MKYLPLALLSGCLTVRGPEPDCPTKALEQACLEAKVIGTNENEALYSAIKDLRECAGEQIKIVCSDTGFNKILTYKR